MPPQGIVTGPVHHRLPISLLSRSNPEDLLVPEDAETPNMPQPTSAASQGTRRKEISLIYFEHITSAVLLSVSSCREYLR